MPTNLQHKIKGYLETNHLSMKGMERKAGLKVNAIRNILSGQSKRPTSETLQAIAQTLGCTVYELLKSPAQSPAHNQNEQHKSPLQKILRYYLDFHGLSVPKLEKKAGLKLHAVTNILTGQSKMPTAQTLHALATAMGCRVEDLLNGDIQALQTVKSEPLKPIASGLEYPEILTESLTHMLRVIHHHKYHFSLHQTLQMLEEIYSYQTHKNPPQVDLVFIEWFLKRAAG